MPTCGDLEGNIRNGYATDNYNLIDRTPIRNMPASVRIRDINHCDINMHRVPLLSLPTP